MKKIILSLVLMFLMLIPMEVGALDTNTTTYYEYLDDGSYYEITIEEKLIGVRSSIVKGNKTAKYKDGNGKACWYVKVTGTFSYNGKSATCTASSVSAGVYDNSWKITNKSSSHSGASASASATATYYYNGKAVDKKTKTVKLSCSANGKLS